MREDMLLNDVARHLSVDAAIVGCIVRPPMRDGDAKGHCDEQQASDDQPTLSLNRHILKIAEVRG